MSTGAQLKGNVAGLLAHRPGLDDLRQRQKEVLAKLDRPFVTFHVESEPADSAHVVEVRAIADEAAVEFLQRWKYEVVEACLGRIPEGLRYVFADPYLASMLQPFFFADTDAGREFRLQIREALIVAFAYPLEDSSRLTLELAPASGMGRGQLEAPRDQTEILP